MNRLTGLVVAGAALAAAGCTNLPGGSLGRTFTAESYLEQEIAGTSFNDYLAQEYQQLAAYNANVMVNWIDTTAYIERSRAAAAGNAPALYQPSEFGVNSDAAALRSQVISAVQANANRAPQACAEAAASYDHYVETLYQAPGEEAPEEARAELEAALAECEGQQVEGVAVFFGFDRYDLTAAAQGVIQNVVSTVGNFANEVVSVVGYTDTVGSDAYNQRLSELRAGSVASYMTQLGVPSGAILTAGRGEAREFLRVPTGDGVREAENRRVEISVSPN